MNNRLHSYLGGLLFGLLVLPLGAGADNATAPLANTPMTAFTPAANGEFTFDTGVLRGTLRPGGKSLGLISVTHVPSGKRLDRSNGLFSHYRVFTKGVRYGGGAWDWPSEAKLGPGGSVEIRWPAATGRPFELRAVYRWRGPAILDLETSVIAEQRLAGFESFLACYFNEQFTNLAVLATPPNNSTALPAVFLPALKSYGDWLMFPRDSAMVPLMTDGRWKLPPNPVDWTIQPAFVKPIAVRRDPASGLAAVIMSPPEDCFAIACPHQTEGHYSVYFSLFGRDVNAGGTLRARARLVFASTPSDQQVLKLYDDYVGEIRR